MLRSFVVGTILLIAGLACSGSGDGNSTPSPTPSSSPTSKPTSTPSTTSVGELGPNEHWFVGVVREVNSSCAVDGICSVSVEVLKHISGGIRPGGETIEVIETSGALSSRCLGVWSFGVQVGDEVDVLAADEDDGRLQICDQERYFVTRIDQLIIDMDRGADIVLDMSGPAGK